MIYTQTLIDNIPQSCKNEIDDIVQTDFDLLIESFIDSILQENKIVISITYLLNNEKLIAIVTYADNVQNDSNIVIPKL